MESEISLRAIYCLQPGCQQRMIANGLLRLKDLASSTCLHVVMPKSDEDTGGRLAIMNQKIVIKTQYSIILYHLYMITKAIHISTWAS